MQPQQGSRIDLAELKAQIVKKIGAEMSKRYFYYLTRFLSQKLSKTEFDKSCYRILGRENLPLHNQLIRSILKNACQAKAPPSVQEAPPVKSLVQTVKSFPAREDGHQQAGSHPNMDVWSNGVFPVSSPRKFRSGIRDRKLRDRPSPLGPNGKIVVSHQSVGQEDNGIRLGMENGDLTPYDHQRPVQHLLAVVEEPEIERDGLVCSTEPRVPSKDQSRGAFVEDAEEVEQANHVSLSTSPLLAPLGIPFCATRVGGARKSPAVASSGGFISYYDSGSLNDNETLKKRMEQIAAVQGLGGVSVECASVLNHMLDVYLKKLIRSCVDLVGTRSTHELRMHSAHKQQTQGKLVNGMWPSNHLHMQSISGLTQVSHEQGQQRSISVLDFKVAMELNPQQLGEDWPWLLEKICMHSFVE
ncbi:hypothetical protein like AT2G24530 [Hibiscus trionum]|uniref:Transcriptional coactivator Hfi1/Transcriptional adapter 1 n=1 Tax=Hibiscus trionum TaxID=183268 RepID=A0A9W7I5N7_HIBTR|nr:hypothetical protein like AT2G24530 [Hibiscus trionum]GMI89520.1 hypothetical protein like AT2G24530 [Hibiscus trionum]